MTEIAFQTEKEKEERRTRRETIESVRDRETVIKQIDRQTDRQTDKHD